MACKMGDDPGADWAGVIVPWRARRRGGASVEGAAERRPGARQAVPGVQRLLRRAASEVTWRGERRVERSRAAWRLHTRRAWADLSRDPRARSRDAGRMCRGSRDLRAGRGRHVARGAGQIPSQMTT